MKIAVVSTPRTCSSLVTAIYTNRYNLTNKLEIFTTGKTADNVDRILNSFYTDDDFVVKITVTSFMKNSEWINPITFPWNIFDKIILTERTPIESQYASWLLLLHAQTYKKLRSNDDIVDYLKQLFEKDFYNFDVRKNTITNIKKTITYYTDIIKPHLLQSNLPVYVVNHALFQNNIDDYLHNLNLLLGETFSKEHIEPEEYVKSFIDYTKFIEQTNLKQLIEDTDVTD